MADDEGRRMGWRQESPMWLDFSCLCSPFVLFVYDTTSL